MHLKDALEPIINELRGVYPSKKVELNAEQASGIWDRDRLQQVFSNLVSNAILHGAPL